MKVANWYFGIGLLAALVALPTSVGAWSYEQIEPAGNWTQVELDVMPTGMVCVCYQNSASGHIFLARRDSIWHRDDLGGCAGEIGHHLVLGPAKKPAILLESDTLQVYTVLTDAGWVWDTVCLEPLHAYRAFLAFDSSGNAAFLLFWTPDPNALLTEHEQGGVWIADTIEVGYHDDLWWRGPTCPSTFVLGPGNRFHSDWGHYLGYTMGYSNVFVDTGRTRAWGVMFTSQGRYASAVSMSPGPASDFALCYNTSTGPGQGLFYCNSNTIETLPAGPGRVRIDSRDIPQIVYRLDVMKHAYRTGVWHIDTLPPEINAAASFDFAVDANDVPLIAFSTANGIFLAAGDAVGVTEKPPQDVREPLRLPTIVRGVLSLPLTDNRLPLGIYDMNGRKVMDIPHSALRTPHSVDVSRLAPGVYFVRSTSGERSAVDKIVITR